jgi:hypothetical protein
VLFRHGTLQCAMIALISLAPNTSCSLAIKAATNTTVGCYATPSLARDESKYTSSMCVRLGLD